MNYLIFFTKKWENNQKTFNALTPGGQDPGSFFTAGAAVPGSGPGNSREVLNDRTNE